MSTESTSKLLSKFLTEDQILEVVIASDEGLMSSARRLQAYMCHKWNLPTLHAVELVKKIREEFK